jgi:small-conductance mechanosensitive channel
LEIFGIRFVGLSAENGRKLLLTLALVLVVVVLRLVLNALAHPTARDDDDKSATTRFWVQQGMGLAVAALLILGLVAIWFDNTDRLTTILGFVSAGLAFALQKVVTSVAGYFVILRGGAFHIGDRIVMGNVRGDVIALGFTRTTVMEIGQSPGERHDDPSVWVRSRQYTGRIVTVTNDKIFDAAVFNYSRDFPYIWEEMTIPVSFKDDYRRAEKIMLEVAARHTVEIGEMSKPALERMRGRYYVHITDLKPRVFMRITDNWVELSVRFMAHAGGGVREMKDRMSRDILEALEEAHIGIASGTYEIVGVPPIKVKMIADGGEQGEVDSSQ